MTSMQQMETRNYWKARLRDCGVMKCMTCYTNRDMETVAANLLVTHFLVVLLVTVIHLWSLNQ